jgi:hypothetical protein
MMSNLTYEFIRRTPVLPPEDDRLVKLFGETGLSLDTLLYSSQFDALVERVKEAGDARTPGQIAHRLLQLRKAAYLPRSGQQSIAFLNLPEADLELMRKLLMRCLGTFGSRDSLPYTDKFDQLWADYNRRASTTLDRYQFWRLVARLSK